jgi:HAD superfamily hydrolase (TIGR01509 family)
MNASMALRGVLLDVDGTLIDSNPAHARAWADAFKEFSYDISAERVQPLIGKGGDKVLPELTGLENESDEAKRLTKRRSEIFKERYLSTLKAFPGSHELLARFKESGLRLVIATSARADELRGLLEQAGLEELVERKTTSSDAEHSKPDPDIIEAALEKGKLEPGEVLMVGDTPYDIESANRAGVRTVAFRCGGWNDADLAGAIAIYDGAAALLRDYDRSPFGKHSSK